MESHHTPQEDSGPARVFPDSSPQITCWRCGHSVTPTPTGTCPTCAAGIASAELPPPPNSPGHAEMGGDADAIRRLLYFYAALLTTTVLLAWTVQGWIPDEATALTRDESARILYAIATALAIDASIVLAALRSIGKLVPLSQYHHPSSSALWWVLALPVLALLLGINFAYHWALLELAGIRPDEDPLLSFSSLFPLVVAVYCIMPAIFEEIFFRHICLGVIRRHVGTHTAVFLTSMMFGLCHIGVLASAPILALVGAGFAYVRIFSGSLLVPILLHFLHNLAIVLFDYRWI